jgi:uncharacterized membrane protein
MASQLKNEFGTLLRRSGLGRPVAWKALTTHVFLLGIFGILLPWLKGAEFMDPAIPTVYACLGPLFAGPAVIQSLREGNSGWPAIWAKIAASTAYGEGMTLAMLLLGIATVLISRRLAYLYLPDPILLGEAILLGLGLTLALTAMSAWITLQFSGGLAKAALRILFVAFFVVFLLRSWWLTSIVAPGAVGSFVLAGFFLLLVNRRRPLPTP